MHNKEEEEEKERSDNVEFSQQTFGLSIGRQFGWRNAVTHAEPWANLANLPLQIMHAGPHTPLSW